MDLVLKVLETPGLSSFSSISKAIAADSSRGYVFVYTAQEHSLLTGNVNSTKVSNGSDVALQTYVALPG
jgi:hypothetical protein